MNRLRRIGKHSEQPEGPEEPSSQPAEAELQADAEAEGAPALGMADMQNGASSGTDTALPPQELPEAAIDDVDESSTEEVVEPSAEDASAVDEADLHDEAVLAPEAGETEETVPVEVESEEMDEAQPEGPPLEKGQTVPLSTVESEELTPLPANAVVYSKYVVQSQLHTGAERNLYRVGARRQQKCGSCGRLSSSDADTCEHCASYLGGSPPADFYLMAESFQPEALMRDASIMDLQLYHPNLVPVVDFFNYKPFGKTRYYAVAEPRQGVRLSQLSMPRPGTQVFGWALQLADVLDYLHSRGVVGAGAEADDILVQGDMASLASLQNARRSPEESEERAQMQSMDLARLASTIYEAYTGYQASMTPEGVLPMPSQAPDKVGTAFRSAIEPVHGIAPTITAAQWRDLLSAALIAIAEMEQPGRPVDFYAGSMTDVGRLREQNQDSFSVTEFSQSSVERPMRIGLYVIGDGMGGHKGGEIASAIAVQVFASEAMARIISPLSSAAGSRPALTNEAILQGMARAVQSANERIYKARDSRQNDMGTTLVAALVAAGKAYIINVGDSRLYFYTKKESDTGSLPVRMDATAPLDGTAPLPSTAPLQASASVVTDELDTGPTNSAETEQEPQEVGEAQDGEDVEQPAQSSGYILTQVSVDHSLVHRLVELGQLDPEEAKVHPHRNFIYRSLGGPPPIEVDTFVRTLHPGDRILICSDGLNSMIEDTDIEAVLSSEQDPDVACRRLIDLANEAGGHDNITTIVIDVTDYLPFPEHPQAFPDA